MKILIGYDGSECADAALEDLQFAGLPDSASARVLSAVEVFLPPKPDIKDFDDPFINDEKPVYFQLLIEKLNGHRAVSDSFNSFVPAAANARSPKFGKYAKRLLTFGSFGSGRRFFFGR
jgi:hypothetical protein